MNEKYLPLGTVVLLKNGTKPVMVIGYSMSSNAKEVYQNGKAVEAKEVYDYCGCVCPEGVINSFFMCMFNHEDIDKILHEGYAPPEYVTYNQKLKDGTALEEFRKKES